MSIRHWAYCHIGLLKKIVSIVKVFQGAQWLSGRVLDSRPRGCGFESHRLHCVLSLSKVRKRAKIRSRYLLLSSTPHPGYHIWKVYHDGGAHSFRNETRKTDLNYQLFSFPLVKNSMTYTVALFVLCEIDLYAVIAVAKINGV